MRGFNDISIKDFVLCYKFAFSEISYNFGDFISAIGGQKHSQKSVSEILGT